MPTFGPSSEERGWERPQHDRCAIDQLTRWRLIIGPPSESPVHSMPTFPYLCACRFFITSVTNPVTVDSGVFWMWQSGIENSDTFTRSRPEPDLACAVSL